MTAARRPIAWLPLIAAMIGGAALTGVAVWRVQVQGIERQIVRTRADLKKLAVSRSIPPNQEVMDYLGARQSALEERYRRWFEMVASPPLAEAASADPQLYFQERFHDVQGTLERLAASRAMPVPEQLGFPKELPPSDTVPRLLVQLELIREGALVILEQGATRLASFKIEDPEPVSDPEGRGTFLTRLSVRVRLASSLPRLMKILSALERATPLIDVRTLRVTASGASDPLEVELLLARYLQPSGALEAGDAEEPEPPASGARAPRRIRQEPGR